MSKSIWQFRNKSKQNTYAMSTNDFGMDDSFADFVQELEQAEQPKACSIDNPECEACGS